MSYVLNNNTSNFEINSNLDMESVEMNDICCEFKARRKLLHELFKTCNFSNKDVFLLLLGSIPSSPQSYDQPFLYIHHTQVLHIHIYKCYWF